MGNDSASSGGPGPHLGGSRTGQGWGYGSGANQGGSSGGPQGAPYAFGPSSGQLQYGSSSGLPQSLGGPTMPAGVNVGGGTGLPNVNSLQNFINPTLSTLGSIPNQSNFNGVAFTPPQPPNTVPQEPLQGPQMMPNTQGPSGPMPQGPAQMANKGPQQAMAQPAQAMARTTQGFRPGIDDAGGGNARIAMAG